MSKYFTLHLLEIEQLQGKIETEKKECAAQWVQIHCGGAFHILSLRSRILVANWLTLASGIDIGQGVNIGPGKIWQKE